jgi:hypothetical protein
VNKFRNIKQLQTIFFYVFSEAFGIFFEAAATACCITLRLNGGQREDFQVYD